MNNATLSFLIAVLIEAIGAVAAYLKERLTEYLRRSGDDPAYDPDFAYC